MAYIVLATEDLTKWAEAKAVKIDTAANAATFLFENIISWFGCPKVLVSDRGLHLLNSLIKEITDIFQIDHRKPTPYHPQTNGQTEQVIKTLVSIIHKTIQDSKWDSDVKFTTALWAYETTFEVTTQTTPFSLVDGIEATLPIKFKVESLRMAINTHFMDSQSLRRRLAALEELDECRRLTAQRIEAIQLKMKATFDCTHKTRTLRVSMLLLLQDARKLEFWGKFDGRFLYG